MRVSDGTLTADNLVTVNLTDVMETPTGLTFSPTSGAPGSVILVTGATSLTVGGTAAITFSAISDNKMTAAGATAVAPGVSAQSFTLTGMRVDSAHVTAANAARLGLYPNPASGTVTVYLQDWQTGGAIPAVELIDALGRRVRRVVFPATVDATTAPVGVPAGIYIVRCGPLAQRLVVE